MKEDQLKAERGELSERYVRCQQQRIEGDQMPSGLGLCSIDINLGCHEFNCYDCHNGPGGGE
jgi:hypothetical protein